MRSTGRILLLLGLLAVVVWTGFAPSRVVRREVTAALDAADYRRWGILLSHLFGVVQALVALVAWRVARWRSAGIDAPHPGLHRRALVPGVLGGLAAVVVTLVTVAAMQGPSAFHRPVVDPWLMAANLYSNFFEEFVFRGFLLAAATAVVGFWPAAFATSLLFGLIHTQYPIPLQFMVAAFGLQWCWLARRTGGVFAPWVAHTLLDWMVDPIL